MSPVAWLACDAGEVPAGDGWLTADERVVQEGLTVPKRRADWRLGRWTAKQAVRVWIRRRTSEPPGVAELSIVAADDGAPEARCHGNRLALNLSISHRAARGVCAVGPDTIALGCDLELLEPRSDAFVREWLAPPEQRLVAEACPDDRPVLANLVWSAKEAAAKAQREGLRLDVRRLVVEAATDDDAVSGWRRIRIAGDGNPFAGWWRAEDGFVLVVVSVPSSDPPKPLSGAGL